MTESNRRKVLETLEALGEMPFTPLQEASGVAPGSFGRVLRELVQDGEVERSDRDYRLPTAPAQTLHFCARCGGMHVKDSSGWRCRAEAA